VTENGVPGCGRKGTLADTERRDYLRARLQQAA
jgi:hypothetical protein